jgi:hypothetical protein
MGSPTGPEGRDPSVARTPAHKRKLAAVLGYSLLVRVSVLASRIHWPLASPPNARSCSSVSDVVITATSDPSAKRRPTPPQRGGGGSKMPHDIVRRA